MNASLLEAISQRVLLGDGAMGTQMQQAGLEPGGCGEAWNLDAPDRVLEIQRRYVEAGSDCLLTNTFGACRIALDRHGRGDDVTAINASAVRIARAAFGERSGLVLGDIGPFGGMLEPYGEVAEQLVHEAFAEQAQALVAAGVDAVIVETQTALEELAIAVAAARAAGASCVIASMAFDVNPQGSAAHTMMGVDPRQAAERMRDLGVDIIGLNCGAGVDVLWATRIVQAFREVCELPVMAQPNAGLPEFENLEVVYKQTPEQMVADLPGLLAAGPRIVGGCCGSAPAHIAAFRAVIDSLGDGSELPGSG